jgi:hypothetical protein
MPRAGLVPMIPVFQREKTVRDLDHAAIVIGKCMTTLHESNVITMNSCNYFCFTGNAQTAGAQLRQNTIFF